ncbi:MAG: lysophospholipid acyltransferase family protein [Planctomycetota bacterium]|nr:lysophospholipid acyltransferase family protein [Planctomycetota bacterium]
MGDGIAAIFWVLNRIYVWFFHGLKSKGNKIIPRDVFPGKLIVVCKHQSPVDPLLIQSQCRFKIRWLMAQEYMKPSLGFIWKHAEVIPVSRDGQDSAALRTALKHLRNNGVIGIFPEGGIYQPREAIHPFTEGIGSMIAHTKSRVLLVTVADTPTNDEIDEAMFEKSQSKVQFVDLIEFPETASQTEITTTLRTRMAEATGWSLVD